MPLEGTWGINFPLIINDLRPQKTTSSKEVAQCQAQALAKCLVWSSTLGWQRAPVPRKNPTLPSQDLVWRGGAELLAKEIGFHHGVRESVLAMDDYASCLS